MHMYIGAIPKMAFPLSRFYRPPISEPPFRYVSAATSRANSRLSLARHQPPSLHCTFSLNQITFTVLHLSNTSSRLVSFPTPVSGDLLLVSSPSLLLQRLGAHFASFATEKGVFKYIDICSIYGRWGPMIVGLSLVVHSSFRARLRFAEASL